MSNICFFCPGLTAGGLERVLSVLSSPLADHYGNVTYLMWYDKPVFYEIDSRVKIISVEKECGSANTVRKMLWMRNYAIKEQLDLFISFSAPFNMLALTALMGCHINIIVSERVDPRSFRWGKISKLLRNLLYHTAKGIIVQTESSKSYFSDNLQRRSIVIGNPIIMEEKMIGAALRCEKKNKVVAVARLQHQKKLDLLIDTFTCFCQQYPAWQLVIYGEGTERLYLEQLVERCGMKDNVFLPGISNHLWDEMKDAEMYVSTSAFEGMSNSLMEAMCLGLPCIATKVSGAVDLIKDGDNGILIDVGDKEMLLESMKSLAQDASLRMDMGQKATMVYNLLKAERVSQQWIDYLDSELAS